MGTEPPEGWAWDEEHLFASTALIGQLGGREVEIGYDNEDAEEMAKANWYATLTFREHPLAARDLGFKDPTEAVDCVLGVMVKNLGCQRCGRPMTLGATNDPRLCPWLRVGPRWVRGSRCREIQSTRRARAARAKHGRRRR